MPITLVTGLPGAFKSTWLLDNVNQLSTAEERPVYYYNIDGLTLDWTPIDNPKEWPELPPRSVIVLDECQDVFPPLAQGAKKPAHYSLLSRHRKLGVDIYLVTQHPSLIDVSVRRLVQEHVHLKRIAGSNQSSCYKSISGVIDVDKGLKAGSKTIYKPSSDINNWHKSAQAHTVKRRKLPLRVFILPLLIIGMIFLAYRLINRFSQDETEHLVNNVSEVELNAVVVDKPKKENAIVLPERKINQFTHGVLEGHQVHLVGDFNGVLIFEMENIMMHQRTIERLGYKLVVVDECMVKIGNTFITCPPEPDINIATIDDLKIDSGGGGESRSRLRPAVNFSTTDAVNSVARSPVSAFHTTLQGAFASELIGHSSKK